MFDFGNISIVQLQLEDANSLSIFLLKNTDRFQRFFPITLKENLVLTKTRKYILDKQVLISEQKEYTLGIKENKSSNIMGLIIIKNIDRGLENGEVAYCIDSEYENQGRMTKIVEQICNFASDEIGLKSLYILTHKTNTASKRVAEKTGFIWAKTLLKSHTPPGEDPLNMEKYVRLL